MVEAVELPLNIQLSKKAFERRQGRPGRICQKRRIASKQISSQASNTSANTGPTVMVTQLNIISTYTHHTFAFKMAVSRSLCGFLCVKPHLINALLMLFHVRNDRHNVFTCQ